MSGLFAWLSPVTMRLLVWALLHFLWQGLALAALFTGLMASFRSPATRYALAVAVLVLMVASPIATFLFLRQSSPRSVVIPTPSARTTMGGAARPVQPGPSQVESGEGISPDTFTWLVRAWMCGVIFFSLRTAGGMLMVERLQRRKAAPVSPWLLQICLDLQSKVGVRRAVRFCQCNGLDVPAVIGWFRPIVLLPMTLLTGLSQTQLEAVVVHELAHVRRWDYFVNLFQIAAETLLFYHPAVWWVSRRIRLERENCCDDTAVLFCGNVVDYARALTYMEGGRTAPSLVMAASGGPLTVRVMRLLGVRRSGGRILGTGLAIGALCLAAGVFMSQAFVRAAHADAKADSVPTLTTKIDVLPKVPVHSLLGKPSVQPVARPVSHLAQASASVPATTPTSEATPATAPTLATQATTSDQSTSQGSYIDSLKAVGLDHLSVDELVAMKIQGVTADYVLQLHELGLRPGPDDLIAMCIQGITSEYIRDMRAMGITANVEELVAMKIQGFTSDYVRGLHDLGLKTDADDLVEMRIQGVTPEYIRDIRALGLNPTTDELVAMQIQGVTPGYIKALSAAGVPRLSADDYVAAKIQGITPEFVEKARQHGFHNLDLDQLMSLKSAGVL